METGFTCTVGCTKVVVLGFVCSLRRDCESFKVGLLFCEFELLDFVYFIIFWVFYVVFLWLLYGMLYLELYYTMCILVRILVYLCEYLSIHNCKYLYAFWQCLCLQVWFLMVSVLFNIPICIQYGGLSCCGSKLFRLAIMESARCTQTTYNVLRVHSKPCLYFPFLTFRLTHHPLGKVLPL